MRRSCRQRGRRRPSLASPIAPAASAMGTGIGLGTRGMVTPARCRCGARPGRTGRRIAPRTSSAGPASRSSGAAVREADGQPAGVVGDHEDRGRAEPSGLRDDLTPDRQRGPDGREPRCSDPLGACGLDDATAPSTKTATADGEGAGVDVGIGVSVVSAGWWALGNRGRGERQAKVRGGAGSSPVGVGVVVGVGVAREVGDGAASGSASGSSAAWATGRRAVPASAGRHGRLGRRRGRDLRALGTGRRVDARSAALSFVSTAFPPRRPAGARSTTRRPARRRGRPRRTCSPRRPSRRRRSACRRSAAAPARRPSPRTRPSTWRPPIAAKIPRRVREQQVPARLDDGRRGPRGLARHGGARARHVGDLEAGEVQRRRGRRWRARRTRRTRTAPPVTTSATSRPVDGGQRDGGRPTPTRGLRIGAGGPATASSKDDEQTRQLPPAGRAPSRTSGRESIGGGSGGGTPTAAPLIATHRRLGGEPGTMHRPRRPIPRGLAPSLEEPLARAKRTDRTEARRRYRAEQARSPGVRPARPTARRRRRAKASREGRARPAGPRALSIRPRSAARSDRSTCAATSGPRRGSSPTGRARRARRAVASAIAFVVSTNELVQSSTPR